MMKIFLLLTLILGILEAIPLLKTGQTNSYDENGTIVTDGSIKDDGYYQTGATPNYSRDGDVVIEHTTGLIWQDDSSVASTYDYSSARASGFVLGNYTNWRRPNIVELASIIDYSSIAISVEMDVFMQRVGGNFWTSNFIDTNNVWAINFSNATLGLVDPNLESSYSKSYLHDRFVHGDLTAPSNLYAGGDSTIKDATTDLQWQNDSSVSIWRTWQDAITYCEGLELDNHTDWRLPNIKELISIVNTFLDSARFFSSTSYSFDPSKAWYTKNNTSNSGIFNNSVTTVSKSNSLPIRCVRNMNKSRQSCIDDPASCGIPTYDSGYADGNTTGWHDGNLSGYYDGNVSGYNYGYTDGNITGFNLGYTDGNLSGYMDGNTSGYLLGHNDGNITGTVYCENNPSEFSLVTLIDYNQAVYDANNTGWHDGNLSGFSDGNLSGYTDGNLSGYIDGNTSGFNLGFTDGNASGYNQGHTIGYNAGDSDGYDRGYPIGFTDGNDTGYGLGRSDAIDDCKAYPEGCGIKPKAVIVPMF